MIHRFGGSRPALLELLPLPHALPTYNAVLTVPPLPLWTSFVDVPLRADSADWVLFVDLGSQVRVYCSGESIEAVEASGRFARAEALFVSFTRAYMREKSGLGIKLGALNPIWIPCLESATEVTFRSIYRIFLSPEMELVTSSGLVIGPASVSDVGAILSTSEVAHSPAYITSILSSSSAIYDPASAAPIAHCFIHLDGSLGTLFVHPAHRRRGLALAVVRDRLRREYEQGEDGTRRRAFACVGEQNERGRAFMRSMGWAPQQLVTWIGLREHESG